MGEERKQTTIRISDTVLDRLKTALREHGQDMNSLVQSLLEEWLRHPRPITTPELGDPEKPVYRLRAYMRCLPAVALVKEAHQRIIFANPEFQRLVKTADIAGHDATDHFERSSAEQIMQHDIKVFDGVPEWFKESVSLKAASETGGEPSSRLCLRFPIKDAPGKTKWTGALGLDWGRIKQLAADLRPSDVNKCVERWSADPLVFWPAAVNSPESLLEEYFRWLPAIATIKHLDGRLLWTNDAYTTVTGRAPKLGELPTAQWPPEVAQRIMFHDRLVREVGVTYVSVDSMGDQGGDRLNIRFPIFGYQGNLEMTGSLGLSHQEVLHATSSSGESA